PVNPPGTAMPAWYTTTASTATARRPLMSVRNACPAPDAWPAGCSTAAVVGCAMVLLSCWTGWAAHTLTGVRRGPGAGGRRGRGPVTGRWSAREDVRADQDGSVVRAAVAHAPDGPAQQAIAHQVVAVRRRVEPRLHDVLRRPCRAAEVLRGDGAARAPALDGRQRRVHQLGLTDERRRPVAGHRGEAVVVLQRRDVELCAGGVDAVLERGGVPAGVGEVDRRGRRPRGTRG